MEISAFYVGILLVAGWTMASVVMCGVLSLIRKMKVAKRVDKYLWRKNENNDGWDKW